MGLLNLNLVVCEKNAIFILGTQMIHLLCRYGNNRTTSTTIYHDSYSIIIVIHFCKFWKQLYDLQCNKNRREKNEMKRREEVSK